MKEAVSLLSVSIIAPNLSISQNIEIYPDLEFILKNPYFVTIPKLI